MELLWNGSKYRVLRYGQPGYGQCYVTDGQVRVCEYTLTGEYLIVELVECLYGGYTAKKLKELRADASYSGALHAHGVYLSTRGDISRDIAGMDEIGKPKNQPYQAIPFAFPEDVRAIASAYNAMPDLIRRIEVLESIVHGLRPDHGKP